VREPQPVALARGRVHLEPWGPQHDSDLLVAARDDEVWRWLPTHRPSTPADVAELRQTHPGLPFAVVVDGRAQGSTSYLDVDVELGGLEVGWTGTPGSCGRPRSTRRASCCCSDTPSTTSVPSA